MLLRVYRCCNASTCCVMVWFCYRFIWGVLASDITRHVASTIPSLHCSFSYGSLHQHHHPQAIWSLLVLNISSLWLPNNLYSLLFWCLPGLCSLNFTASESLIQTTSHNCWTVFAPLLANVMCCPQLDAALTIILGKASKQTGQLALNRTQSKHCLSDLEQILVGKGASSKLGSICSLHSSNLTASSCPVTDVDQFDSAVDTSKLLLACEKVDPVKECCEQACQNAILDAATNITLNASEPLMDNSVRISDCKNIVHRWLATKLDPSQAKETLRGLANCKLNRGKNQIRV